METVTQKPTETATPGKPAFVSDQPATPTTGIDKTGDKPTGGQSAIDAAKAAIAAKAKPATPAAPAAAATTETPKPAEITDDAIAAAADKAKAIADAKAAAIQPEDDYAAKVAKAHEASKAGDHLKALEILGIPLDGAVRQATGAPATTTEEEKLRAENARLKEENDKAKRDSEAKIAEANAAAARAATTAAIIADAAFPNITTAAQVDEALKPAKEAYKALVADVGRELNDTERDRLVRHFLKKFNDQAQTATETPAAKTESSVKAGTVTAAPKVKRSITQVKADILAKKKN